MADWLGVDMDESTLPASRTCTKCGEEKSASEFYVQRYTGKRAGWSIRLHPSCKDCHRARTRLPKIPEKPCEYCGTLYWPRRRDSRWCQRQCFEIWQRRRDGVQPFMPAVVDGMKKCNDCLERKPISEFYPGGKPGKYNSRCKVCATARARAYIRSPKGRNQRYLRDYGVTLDWYEQALQFQGGKCALCDGPPRRGKRLGVDHCHATGAPRALLCDTCNKGLGHFRDDPDLMRKAAEYVTAHAQQPTA